MSGVRLRRVFPLGDGVLRVEAPARVCATMLAGQRS